MGGPTRKDVALAEPVDQPGRPEPRETVRNGDRIPDLSLDLLTRRAERAGKPIDLRPREYGLLEYLLRNQGRVLTKTMILSHVWGYNFDPGTNVVDVLVSRLREKIDRDFEPKLLHTVRGVGYTLKADPT